MPTAIEGQSAARQESQLVVNRLPDLGDDIELPGLGVQGTISVEDLCISIETNRGTFGLIVPMGTKISGGVDGQELVLAGPDGRSYREGQWVFFGGLAGSAATVYSEMSERAGLLNEAECPGPYAGWPYWSEACFADNPSDLECLND